MLMTVGQILPGRNALILQIARLTDIAVYGAGAC
jgi:hypothetical protein